VLDGDGFPRAGVADDDHRLSFVDLEGKPLKDALRAEGFVDVDEFYHVSPEIGQRTSDIGGLQNVMWQRALSQ
jgi:hypothetical protein